MCGRYILVQKPDVIRKRFAVTIPEEMQLSPSYNIAPGKYAPVITCEEPHLLQLFRFGLTPSWSKKKTMFINARAEGDNNPENAPDFNGTRGIISKPAFRKAIRSQRCLIPADAYIEGTTKEKLSKPFLVYLRNKVRPFAFAGIYDTWLNPETGDEICSFSIITSAANELIRKLPHERAPVILHREQEREWLNTTTPLNEIAAMLQPYPAERMNAYPIAPTIKNPQADDPGLIHPAGPKLIQEGRN